MNGYYEELLAVDHNWGKKTVHTFVDLWQVLKMTIILERRNNYSARQFFYLTASNYSILQIVDASIVESTDSSSESLSAETPVLEDESFQLWWLHNSDILDEQKDICCVTGPFKDLIFNLYDFQYIKL